MGQRIDIQEALRQIRASGAGGPMAGQRSPEGVLALALEEERRLGRPLDQKVDTDILEQAILARPEDFNGDTLLWWAQTPEIRQKASEAYNKDPGLTPQGALMLVGVLVGAAVIGAAAAGTAGPGYVGLAATPTAGATGVATSVGSMTAEQMKISILRAIGGSQAPTLTGAARAAAVKNAVLRFAVPAVASTAAVGAGEGVREEFSKPDTPSDTTTPTTPTSMSPADAAAAAASGGTLMITDPMTGKMTPITGASGSAVQDMLRKLQNGGSGTLTSEDWAYMSSTGVDPMAWSTLAAMDSNPDAQRIWFDKGNTFQAANNRLIDQQEKSGQLIRRGNGPMPTWESKKTYSYREAINLPRTLGDAELMEWAKKLWEAGFLNAEVDYTKPFEEQWAPDRYDPKFQQAWQALLATSVSDPSKSAKQILEERRKARLPLIEKARQKALEDQTKEALNQLSLPDPASLSDMVEAKMQEILKRNPTEEERKAIMAEIGKAYAAQATAIMGKDQVVPNVDPAARAEDIIEKTHATEAGGVATADAFSMFRSLLGPGGI